MRSFGTDGVPIAGGLAGTLARGESRAFFARVSMDGTLEGGATFDPSRQGDAFRSVVELGDGDFIAVGYANVSATEVSDHQVLVVRIHPDGTQDWSQTYGPTEMSSGINFATEFAADVAVSPTGRLFVLGGTRSGFPGATGESGGAFVMEIDRNDGTVRWARDLSARSRGSLMVASADAIYVVLSGGGGDTPLDLGAAGTFDIEPSSEQAIIVALSQTDGAPTAAYLVPGAPSSSVESLELDDEGLLFSASRYIYTPTEGTRYRGGFVYVASPAVTDARVIAQVDQSTVSATSAVRTSSGDVLVTGSVGSEFQGEAVPGYRAGRDLWMVLFDRHGRQRFHKFDGDGVAYETMRAVRGSGDRVFLYGYYTGMFRFETQSIATGAGSTFGGCGYLMGATIAE